MPFASIDEWSNRFNNAHLIQNTSHTTVIFGLHICIINNHINLKKINALIRTHKQSAVTLFCLLQKKLWTTLEQLKKKEADCFSSFTGSRQRRRRRNLSIVEDNEETRQNDDDYAADGQFKTFVQVLTDFGSSVTLFENHSKMSRFSTFRANFIDPKKGVKSGQH